MKLRLFILLVLITMSMLVTSCEDEHHLQPQWITVPEYNFPIYIAKRGGVVTTVLETFDVTGFLEEGDPGAFSDSLEWKVIPYNYENTKSGVPNTICHDASVGNILQ